MTTDAELLEEYASDQSEAAFAELTKRYVDLVYSAALRSVYGDGPAAEDITQQVFTKVARQAKRLARHPALVGWLYTTTRLTALHVNRTEQRRKTREQEALTMNELLQDDSPPPDWTQLRPVLEDVMHELNDKDRLAVLLRFFQNKTLAEVGASLNLTQSAAHMRVERALEKLRRKLERRGIKATAMALAALVSANAVQAAPVGFAAVLPGAAIAASAGPALSLVTVTKTLAMTTLQKSIVATALVAAVGTGIYAFKQNAQFNAQIRTLQTQQQANTAQIQQLEQQHDQASEQMAALRQENALLKSGRSEAELLKLRGEVGALKRKAASDQANAVQPTGGLAKMMSDPAMKEYMRKAMKDKMNSLYADFIKETKLTPEQSDQFLQLLCDEGTRHLDQLTATAQGTTTQPDTRSRQEIANQMHDLLGDAGSARFKAYSEEMPARATLSLLNAQLGAGSLSEEQSANLIRIIKTEPSELTQGIVGGPDKAFLGSQVDIDNFLQQVSESNQRVLQQAGSFLTADQLTALDTVLVKAIDARKLQGAAFFQKH